MKTNYWYRLFIAHPKSVGKSYWVHAFHAFKYSLIMIVASMICLIHALFPGVFKHTASSMLKKIIGEIDLKSNKNKDQQ